MGREVRTRDMAPSYKDPTVQESQPKPTAALAKQKHTLERRRRKRGEEEGKRARGRKKNHTKMAGVGFGVAAVPGQSKQ